LPSGLVGATTPFTGRQQLLDNNRRAVDVDIGEKCLPLPHKPVLPAAILGGCCVLEHDMAGRPSDLAERISNREPDDGLSRETFRLPVEVARAKAREILNQFPQGGYSTVVEQWQQLPDGQIEFTMRRLRAAD
jgi:hypothetical protein